MSNRTAALTLVIINPTETGGGASIEHKFSTGGGSIGTAANDTWRLSPHRTGAVAGHAEVRYLDGGFCLIDRSGRTYINSSSQPVGRGRRARLNHGDTLTIGRYRMRAELNGEAAVNSGMEEDAGQHRQLVDVAEGSLLRSESGQALPDGREPLEGLHTPAGEPISEDPLAPWPNTQERQGMSESTEQSREAKDTSRQHISGAPLMRGMEAEIDFADSDEMRLFLEEAGQTLKATVEGLLALHQGEDSRHRALRTRLQPIEDNPLRLGDDYAGTMQTLFAAERSPVHLSAPAAVRESLESLNHHQQATREAIREALEAILYAFSPEALLRRFHGYRRGLQDNEDEGRWAWNMYQHYYRELRSSRQQGFERLFQEVFDQAYDQHLRQLQRENV
ncbi:type VI secretion system-associated FHA domain protein TagH [Marinobacter sp. G11]|uniref:type VI secretion system-associated FHA domain protein TagH n=1 Tax=Marinobacter sp. G11 TaxID=2903522 RepID=UPI001E3150A7|nr:type VI secretion system-associated FHA domain protein TagH [uncultured Marinobacter sp.]MCE0759205.1 type VI secretion system-associated FHA domain protein TagH [Marinobacter sp. G11]